MARVLDAVRRLKDWIAVAMFGVGTAVMSVAWVVAFGAVLVGLLSAQVDVGETLAYSGAIVAGATPLFLVGATERFLTARGRARAGASDLDEPWFAWLVPAAFAGYFLFLKLLGPVLESRVPKFEYLAALVAVLPVGYALYGAFRSPLWSEGGRSMESMPDAGLPWKSDEWQERSPEASGGLSWTWGLLVAVAILLLAVVVAVQYATIGTYDEGEAFFYSQGISVAASMFVGPPALLLVLRLKCHTTAIRRMAGRPQVLSWWTFGLALGIFVVALVGIVGTTLAENPFAVANVVVWTSGGGLVGGYLIFLSWWVYVHLIAEGD